MENLTIKDHIQGEASFVRFVGGNLYYRTSTGLEFPVPIEDLGNATINATEKGMLLMRYIRKHMDTLKKAQEAKA